LSELPDLSGDLASFVRSAGDAIIIFDAKGSLRALNDAAHTMPELADKPESQLSMQFIIPGAESLLALPFQRALEGQVTRNLHLQAGR